MSDFLTQMAQSSRGRAEALSRSELKARLSTAPPLRGLDLGGAGFDIIAEVKLTSPSSGRLATEHQVVGLAEAYTRAGAVAISVLTEDTRFAGSLGHLASVLAVTDLPVIRKDFLVDPVQLLEARVAGASGVLLIARLLPGGLLAEMVAQTLALGMFALVEVFDPAEMASAAEVCGPQVLLGVNARDLNTLQVDPTRFRHVAALVPDGVCAVAESGLSTPEQAAEVAALGYRAALVGSALSGSTRPAETLRILLSAGRSQPVVPR